MANFFTASMRWLSRGWTSRTLGDDMPTPVGLSANRHVEIVLHPSVNFRVSVALHQLFDLTSLGLFVIVFDVDRSKLIAMERKCAERFELGTFDIEAHVVDVMRSICAGQDVGKGDCRELDRRSLLR